jgi:hypothetical protein
MRPSHRAATIASSIGAYGRSRELAVVGYSSSPHFQAAGDSIVSNIYEDGSYVSLNPTWQQRIRHGMKKIFGKAWKNTKISFHCVAEVGCVPLSS